MSAKKIFLFIALIINLFAFSANAQKKGVLTVNTRFTGILNGYDLQNKTMVYVDGMIAGETTEKLQSEPNTCSLYIPRGKHTIRIVNMARNNGRWEEHTYKNNYSIDAFFESRIKIRKKHSINLVFDITTEKTFATLK